MIVPATSRERRALRIVAEGRVREQHDSPVRHVRVLGDQGVVYNVILIEYGDTTCQRSFCDCGDERPECKHVLAALTYLAAPESVRAEVDRIADADGWR
jgi:uncharacterized Zn finger protein